MQIPALNPTLLHRFPNSNVVISNTFRRRRRFLKPRRNRSVLESDSRRSLRNPRRSWRVGSAATSRSGVRIATLGAGRRVDPGAFRRPDSGILFLLQERNRPKGERVYVRVSESEGIVLMFIIIWKRFWFGIIGCFCSCMQAFCSTLCRAQQILLDGFMNLEDLVDSFFEDAQTKKKGPWIFNRFFFSV